MRSIESPFSNPAGRYDTSRFQPSQKELELQAMLPENEYLEPMITQETIAATIEWFCFELKTLIETYGLENMVFLYNRKGGWKVFKAIKDRMRQADINIDIGPHSDYVQVSTTTGKEQFGTRINKSSRRRHTEKDLKDKVVVFLDDIGDTGTTMRICERYATLKGALKIITVNMLEKMIDQPKKHTPTYALLMIINEFLLGLGLDSNTSSQQSRIERAIPNVVAKKKRSQLPATASAA